MCSHGSGMTWQRYALYQVPFLVSNVLGIWDTFMFQGSLIYLHQIQSVDLAWYWRRSHHLTTLTAAHLAPFPMTEAIVSP